MTLSDYMTLKRLTDDDFGRLIGLDRTGVMRIRKGERHPSPSKMIEIARETGGAVTPNDFILPATDEAHAA